MPLRGRPAHPSSRPRSSPSAGALNAVTPLTRGGRGGAGPTPLTCLARTSGEVAESPAGRPRPVSARAPSRPACAVARPGGSLTRTRPLTARASSACHHLARGHGGRLVGARGRRALRAAQPIGLRPRAQRAGRAELGRRRTPSPSAVGCNGHLAAAEQEQEHQLVAARSRVMTTDFAVAEAGANAQVARRPAARQGRAAPWLCAREGVCVCVCACVCVRACVC